MHVAADQNRDGLADMIALDDIGPGNPSGTGP